MLEHTGNATLEPIHDEIPAVAGTMILTTLACLMLRHAVHAQGLDTGPNWMTNTLILCLGVLISIKVVRRMWHAEIGATHYDDLARLRGEYPVLDAEIARVGERGCIKVFEYNAALAIRDRLVFEAAREKALAVPA